MTGRDDNGKPPLDDGDDWIDRDDDNASGPLVDRDDDEPFGNEAPRREPGFPEEREYPEVPDWDDEGSDPDSAPEWDAPSADNDDLNRLASRDLDELGDDPYPPGPDESLSAMAAGLGARDDVDRDASDSIDGDSEDLAPFGNDPRPEDPLPVAEATDDTPREWRDPDSDDSVDDSWSDDSEPAAAARPDAGPTRTEHRIPPQDAAPVDPSEDTASRRWPIAMLAIAAVAVVLLAVGGYGVISERSALEAEIRELQAQLATAVSPEEARAGRDALEAARQKNTSLEAELTTLQAENTELQQMLSDMEARMAARMAEAEQAVAAAQQAAESAARRSAQAAGDWFVNFGSYAQADIARRWADRLQVDSGRVMVQDAQSQGRTLYRVRVVGLADKATADRVARQLEAKHELPKLWVGKN